MRYRVTTTAGEEFHFEAATPGGVREGVELRDDSIEDITPDPEPMKWFKSELEWDEDKWLTWAAWIEEAIQTDAIEEWIAVWPDWQLRFILEPDSNLSYEPGQQKAVIFPCSKEEYDFTQLGDGYPSGFGELTYLSMELVEWRPEPVHLHDPEERVKVSLSFENPRLDEF